MPQATKRSRLLILAPLSALLIGVLFLVINLYSSYDGEDFQFNIRKGEGFSQINYRLHQNKLISSPSFFHYYTKFKNKITAFKAGTYLIPKNSNTQDILYILTEGTPILSKVTIPEGKNMYEIGKLLEKAGITQYSDFIKMCKNPKMVKLIGEDAPSVEGYLFPETYMFAPKTTAKEVIQKMISVFKQKTKFLDLELGALSPYEVVTLASIVEKETGAAIERPTIAGVYLNRLKKRMRLQADPTTIYGIWENFDGNLKKKHLLQKTDYNTYKINGLPLGPIANPSLAAIKAVLKPKQHSYIYFVSKNDGTHIFTSTYKEHLKAVNFWQKNHKNRKGKSWRDLKQ